MFKIGDYVKGKYKDLNGNKYDIKGVVSLKFIEDVLVVKSEFGYVPLEDCYNLELI